MDKKICKKEYLTQEETSAIKELEQVCTERDGISFKLELDYKLALSETGKENNGEINDYLFYCEDKLIAYLGICSFGGQEMEVSGMVHFDYRRQGVFTELFMELKKEIQRRKPSKVLFLTDRLSESGEGFILKHKGQYEFSEYEMYLDMEEYGAGKTKGKLVLRKADNRDAEEIRRQNALYMDSPIEDVEMVLPEEEEGESGCLIYLAEVDGKTVGKMNLQIFHKKAGIYGLGILPEYRGNGFGRALLLKSVEKSLEMNAEKVMLQVEVENRNALGLYESVGFRTTSTMDYYKLF